MAMVKQAGYYPLTENSAKVLAKSLGFFSENEELDSTEIGDGNLNYVFRIVSKSFGKSIIIKQALPYAKVVGESMPLTLKRAQIESSALKKYSEFTPESVPKVFYTDNELALTIMEDLSDYKILRKGLNEGATYPLLANHVGTYLAKTLFFTSDFGLNGKEKKELVGQFINPELCKITEDLVFTDPFYDHDSNDFEDELREKVEGLWQDHILKLEVGKLKRKFLTQADALLHGDLHTGSIFVKEEETKIIDPEFAFFGPIGFDIGQFFANILLNALSRPKADQPSRISIISETWSIFRAEFTKLWLDHNQETYSTIAGYLDHILDEIFEDSIGFAGCEIIRRTIGLAHVADLDGIQNPALRIKAKTEALDWGRRLVLQRKLIKVPEQIALY
ncbi:S-methyl-5-thioribose kinase [Rossellomorea vietnamensis]|uniref:Methylthioribose kinase n=1 Tax=Rossellomorea vietnamensis TaxID=218284 RepID=A0A5D4MCY1_9BACI|nr:S-methyl-5-thioribose kinase [Rossellomorea vietnamensis]TYR99307.1 S-methyl-5-thioribose kinase [Rossellomorea vietnamensis]